MEREGKTEREPETEVLTEAAVLEVSRCDWTPQWRLVVPRVALKIVESGKVRTEEVESHNGDHW